MPRDRLLLEECRQLQAALRRHASLAELRRSEAWPALERRIEAVLSAPIVTTADPGRTAASASRTRPADGAEGGQRVRAVHWNIEHGNHYQHIESALCGHAQLADADLVLLNEVDLGMARSGNRDVAADLAAALGLHVAFAPLFIETTVGRDDDALTAGSRENEEALFGIAILSRHPIGAVRVVPLPSPVGIQFDHERMFGRHVALVATIERPGAPFTAVSAHLEVLRTREHRAAQMRTLLEALAEVAGPVILAGDFNTQTLDRGRPRSRLEGAVVLALWPPAALAARLRWPDRGPYRERLFDELARAGFEWDRFNDRESTLRLRLHRLDEVRTLPRPFDRLAPVLLAHAERRAAFRLDWFAGRGWRGGRGYTVRGLDGPGEASDHAPIVAEFESR
jgi:endonuclease/exonuclease/phosphatase family metal-dependent hydrolase